MARPRSDLGFSTSGRETICKLRSLTISPKRFFHKMGPTSPLTSSPYIPWSTLRGILPRAKPFDSDSLAEILVSAGKFARDGFRRKFDADFPLHGT